jgi:hypothetical protein
MILLSLLLLAPLVLSDNVKPIDKYIVSDPNIISYQMPVRSAESKISCQPVDAEDGCGQVINVNSKDPQVRTFHQDKKGAIK